MLANEIRTRARGARDRFCSRYAESDKSHEWAIVSIIFEKHYKSRVEYGVANHLPKRAHEHALFCRECEHIIFLTLDDNNMVFKNSKFMSKYEIDFDDPIPSCKELCMISVLK